MTELKDLAPILTAIASVVTASTVVIAAGKLVFERHSLMAETDLKAATLLSTLMGLAEARGPAVYAEPLLQKLLLEKSAAEVIEKRSNAFVTAPVGAATQRTAIYAIAALGKRYKQFRPAAISGLKRIAVIGDELAVDAKKALDIIPGGNDG